MIKEAADKKSGKKPKYEWVNVQSWVTTNRKVTSTVCLATPHKYPGDKQLVNELKMLLAQFRSGQLVSGPFSRFANMWMPVSGAHVPSHNRP